MLLLFLHACGGTVLAPVETPGEHAKKETKASSVPTPTPKSEQVMIPTPITTPSPIPTPKTEPGLTPMRLADYHVVDKGDTLYSIAWHYGFDYRDIAAWNVIKPPYVIYPGQRIYLRGKPGLASAPAAQTTRASGTTLTPGPIFIKKKPGAESGEKEPAPPPSPNEAVPLSLPLAESVTWSWPTEGSIVRTDSPIANNGIDIAGKRGQQINASAPGEVVYSDSGLLGYGRLIIIKHNDTFLSAYAHNSELLVKEGDRVMGGQNIALMGETTDGKAVLHFEIRKNGQPIDPLKYLPSTD